MHQTTKYVPHYSIAYSPLNVTSSPPWRRTKITYQIGSKWLMEQSQVQVQYTHTVLCNKTQFDRRQHIRCTTHLKYSKSNTPSKNCILCSVNHVFNTSSIVLFCILAFRPHNDMMCIVHTN